MSIEYMNNDYYKDFIFSSPKKYKKTLIINLNIYDRKEKIKKIKNYDNRREK